MTTVAQSPSPNNWIADRGADCRETWRLALAPTHILDDEYRRRIVKVRRVNECWPQRCVATLDDGREVQISAEQFNAWLEPAAAEERERDDDETLFAGQNYGYLAENGEY